LRSGCVRCKFAHEEAYMGDRRTVMVSSTVRDLEHHRDAVMNACLAVGAFPRMMEHLPATDSEAATVSKAMVDQSDVYVGVFAHRYGYVPPGATKSVTEMEYERAVARGIPRLIFLMHDDYSGLRASDVDTGSNADRLRDLKSRLGTERVVKFYKSPDDLRAGVILALNEYVAAPAPSPKGGSNLTISALSGARRLKPLDGHPVLTAPDGTTPVFAGGVNLSFTVAHNGEGNRSINLHTLEIDLVRFEPGARVEYAYELDADAIIGAGTAKPHVFAVRIDGDRVGRADWVVDAKAGITTSARSANFFDTNEPQILTFPADRPDIEELQGTVFAGATGLYEFRFRFLYSVGGIDHEHVSETIRVYADE
jgi:hypothetical protein